MFRRGPAIVLSLVLGAAALVTAPCAVAGDGGTAKDKDPCSDSATVKLRVEPYGDDRFEATGVVWSDDEDVWDWRFRHDDVSARGSVRAKDADRSFRMVRTRIGVTDRTQAAVWAERSGL
ncbi:hypothetical protein ACT8ZV_11315 [Nocardioides sp. MAHUQ-72]|uniref:hypothetical protein n=1 Tax=unclassified Nocardioides TaxID=2615069 RepID=UPI00360E393D